MWAALLIPFFWIDRQLQRGFDALFFFLMRRGVSRRAIRRNMWAALVAVQLSYQGAFVWDHIIKWSPWEILLSVGMGVWIVRIWVRELHHDDREDARAENKNALSKADLPWRAWAAKSIGWLYVWMSVSIWFFPGPDWSTLRTLAEAATGVLFLAQGYLVRTPPQPPSKEPASAALRAEAA